MPSKSKKQSKTPSRHSNSDPSASPRTPSVTSVDAQVDEEDLRGFLDEVSRQYPSLIGKSAFIGRVNHVDSETRSCKIWLSESSVVASYLTPGSLVSVSLAALKNKHSNGFPLSSVTDEYDLPFGVGSADEIAKEAGNYFALATVFPSCKVLKNGVRLSSSLSYALGSPSSGSIVFVYPIQSEFQTGLINGSERGHNLNANCLSLYGCQQLHLEPTSKNTVNTNYDLQSKMECSAGKTHENGITSSPKTPLYQPKLSSLRSTRLDSPFCEGSASNISKPNGLCSDSFDVKEILRDESSKKLLEACATSWLYSRNLLRGNIVAIPILSELCIFRVIGAGISNQDLTNGNNHSLAPQTLEPTVHVNSAFVIDHKSKVYLCSPSDLSSENQFERPSPCVQHDLGDVKTIVEQDISELGGLSREYAILREIIFSLVKNALSSFGLQTTKGVLLHGPPGTGKTSLARLCVRDAGVSLFCVNGPEIVSEYHGESEQELHKVFESAIQAAPSVLFIDELDAIAPARKEGGEQLSQRMVATLLNLMDGVSTTDGVLVIAATNRPDSIEPALRRPGRFDRELEIGVPSPKQRLDILHTLLRKIDHCISDIQVQQLAMTTHGFVGADLASLCNEAALVCLRRYSKFKVSSHGQKSFRMPITYVGLSGNNMEGMECTSVLRDISTSFLDSSSSCKLPDSSEAVLRTTASIQNGIDNISEGTSLVKENCLLRVVFEDFEKARMKVRPSAMREIILEVPKVNWEDVGGQREVKTQLMEAVEWPQKHQDAFKRIGTRPPTGVLMFGPPGCSKTLMARAVASEAGLNFLAVKGPELFSKWVGESEKAVRSLFAKVCIKELMLRLLQPLIDQTRLTLPF
ncbi:calmodulin-interacting protein 111-like isoform X3 [Hibiscus syriacus]|uniref:calmodulin-interacting protein 111-like isoform X3 n=1 Tax=Hibiscus syriacus TaxID=106335 RepID=UPI001922F436|nr:calmodulin-interacting protein 111-like isoform X3 [Hibiscus syriacus]